MDICPILVINPSESKLCIRKNAKRFLGINCAFPLIAGVAEKIAERGIVE
jgi:hypothetical protein